MDLDKRQLQPEASASGSAADTASSLRAAALLSRKRRKVVTETPVSLPPRPAAEPSLHLDYGQDETPTSSTQSVPMKTKPEPQAERTSMTSSQMEDIEDGQIREEGEISDTETSPPPPPQRRTPPRPPKVPQSSSTAQLNNPETGKTETVQLPPLMDPAVVSPPVQSDVRSRQGNVASPEPFIFETATYRLDANHVRPGLAMTQEQYNIAKDIVLDLLGWGVPPEYLVDCGLSRHVVFYVFMELNLRLPNNLDVHGLIPYPTPEMLALLPVSPSLSSRSLLSSSAMPPPSMIPVRGPLDLAERLDTDQTDLDMSSPDRSPYVKAEPSSPSAADMAASHSLLMIEQQRRQELLARKAVIASRKARQTDPADPTTYSSDQDVDRASIPSQSVDDFLKTIEPTSQGDVGEDIVSDRSTWFFSPERMDVDEPIPGLTVTSGNSDTLSTGPSSAQSTSTSVVLPTEPNSPANLPPGSSDILRSNDTRYQPSTSTTSSDMANSFSPTPYTHSSFSLEGAHPQRRGAKRPVAADFVDFDSAAGPSRGYGGYASNGYSNGGTHPTNLLKRKSGSFAGVSGVRRCVIELSDSEEDGDSQTVGEYLAHVDAREYSPAIAGSTRLASRIGSATPSIGFAVGNGGQHTVTGNGTSPAALQEKEQEIRKMRQLIAQREELRLKKLAAMSGKSTPVVTASPEARASAALAKQEDPRAASFGGNERSLNPEIDHDPRNGTGESISTDDIPGADTSTEPQQTTDASTMGSNIYGPAGATGGVSAPDVSSIGHEIPAQNGDSDDEQELTVTGETSSAQAVLPMTVEQRQSSSAAGDSGASSSAQVLQYPNSQSQDGVEPFQPAGFNLLQYDSPLAAYPRLRSRLRPATRGSDSILASAQTLSELTIASPVVPSSSLQSSSSPICITSRTPYSVPSHSSTLLSFPDLKVLKQAVQARALGQLMASNASLRVCQYEVPGGGVCRDIDCDELHLSRISSEPSDAELAAYVHSTLPEPWCRWCDVHAIEIALDGVRLRGGAKDADTRVREALAGLGIPIG